VEHKPKTPAVAAEAHRPVVRNTVDIPHQRIFVVLDCMVMNLLIHLESLVVLGEGMLDVLVLDVGVVVVSVSSCMVVPSCVGVGRGVLVVWTGHVGARHSRHSGGIVYFTQFFVFIPLRHIDYHLEII
jgi:hypothetical protein